METLGTIMLAHTRQLRDEFPMIWLYEIGVLSSPAKRFRLTNFDRKVNFGTDSLGDPVVYSPFPIAHGDLRVTRQADLPQFQIQVGTASLEMIQYFEDFNGLIGGPATIRLVSSADLLNPNSQLAFYGQVTECQVRTDRTALSIGPLDLQNVTSPAQRFKKFHCRHRFGGPACGADLTDAGFVAEHPTCDHTHENCEEIGATEAALGLPVLHPLRWGGFLGISRVSRQ